MKNIDITTCTVQEACDYAVQQLVKQGKPCIAYADTCAYGDGQGNHCAIGWLLDHNNKELMDAEGPLESLILCYGARIPRIIKDNRSVFRDLQIIHDSAAADDLNFEVTKKALVNKNIDISGPHWTAWFSIVKQMRDARKQEEDA